MTPDQSLLAANEALRTLGAAITAPDPTVMDTHDADRLARVEWSRVAQLSEALTEPRRLA